MRRRRGATETAALCSDPGKLCEALAIMKALSELPIDRPPIALHARNGEAEVITGVRIGLTKAVDLPWRYGLKGSKFLSKRF
jgi:DNA-3-methyladenine glycosylase